VLGEYAQDLLSMGIMIIAIGTHSFRKGIATFLSSVPGGPSAIAIYLRAGWSLRAVQQRYIFEGEGGPYRELRSFDLPIAADQQILSRAKLVMCKLIENSGQDRQRDIKSLPIRERDDCFESAFMSVHRMIFPDAVMTLIDKRRIGDVSFITLYDLIRKASKNLQ
jgi:hypothetical protein